MRKFLHKLASTKFNFALNINDKGETGNYLYEAGLRCMWNVWNFILLSDELTQIWSSFSKENLLSLCRATFRQKITLTKYTEAVWNNRSCKTQSHFDLSRLFYLMPRQDWRQNSINLVICTPSIVILTIASFNNSFPPGHYL